MLWSPTVSLTSDEWNTSFCVSTRTKRYRSCWTTRRPTTSKCLQWMATSSTQSPASGYWMNKYTFYELYSYSATVVQSSSIRGLTASWTIFRHCLLSSADISSNLLLAQSTPIMLSCHVLYHLEPRDLWIGNFRSNLITNRIGGCDSNSNWISNRIRV